MDELLGRRAGFTEMTAASPEDWDVIKAHAMHHAAGLADRVVAHLELLKGDFGGFAVDRLEHSLQAATRAHQAGMDEEYVVCALLHDIGDTLAAFNHADLAATILKPFVSERNHWMLEKHGIFQGYYFFHHIGLDRDAREAFRGHPDFAYTADFCERFDQNAFDPAFASLPLEAFVPMVRRVMARPRRSIYVKAAE